MKNFFTKIINTIVCGFAVFCVLGSCCGRVLCFSGGDGTALSPYIIDDETDLTMFSEAVNIGNDFAGKYIKLTRDFDISEIYFDGQANHIFPIGTPEYPFAGFFNGGGHTVTRLTLNLPDKDFVGFFGYTGLGSSVKNIKITDSYFCGKKFVGALAGYNSGFVQDSFTDARVSSIKGYAGTFAGANEGHVSKCKARGEATGKNVMGGFAGLNCGNIVNSCFEGSACGVFDCGGFVGCNLRYITSCRCCGDACGRNNVGGFAGVNEGDITSCESFASALGHTNIGGFVGVNYLRVFQCVAKGSVEGKKWNIGGFVGYNMNFVNESSAFGVVQGKSEVGGFAGKNLSVMLQCKSFGEVSGKYHVDDAKGEYRKFTQPDEKSL